MQTKADISSRYDFICYSLISFIKFDFILFIKISALKNNFKLDSLNKTIQLKTAVDIKKDNSPSKMIKYDLISDAQHELFMISRNQPSLTIGKLDRLIIITIATELHELAAVGVWMCDRCTFVGKRHKQTNKSEITCVFGVFGYTQLNNLCLGG